MQLRGGSTAAEVTFWKASTSVICKRAHGTRTHDHVMVTVGERYSTVTNFYVFQRPVLSSILNGNVPMHSTPSITGVRCSSMSVLASFAGALLD